MSRERRSDLILGILLVLVGGWFLAAQFKLVPGLSQIMDVQYQWPLLVVGVGVLLFLLGLLVKAPGMSVPACIVGGIGGILYWANLTGNWGSWSYLWTLIPGFVGLGILLSGLLGGAAKDDIKAGLRLLLISAVLFAIFFMLLSGQATFAKYWPVLIILAGLWIVLQTIFRHYRNG